MNSLAARAKEWMQHDPDTDTVAELSSLLDNEAALAERFRGSLEFGTAGLRGLLGAGESRMNLAVVCTTTAALLEVVEQRVPDARRRGVIIGYDGRHKSADFAAAAAKIARGAGFSTWLFSGVAPTPLVAFAAQRQKAACAIVITASHNPPEYNGYKVYWDNGAQIIPPIDGWIREASERSVRKGAKAILDACRNSMAEDAPAAWREEYIKGALALRVHPELNLSTVRIAYTPMHGVGGETAAALFSRAELKFDVVSEQRRPNPLFPTVRFPNPEEPGAMDLVMKLGVETGADLAIANDPDADRLAVAVREEGAFRILSGNEIGTMLGAYLLAERHVERPIIATTVVSSRQLQALANLHRARYLETLTGFKWIANQALATEGDFIFGYEEALGFTVGTLVRDKDGIASALVFAEMFAWLKKRGMKVAEYQQNIAARIGVFKSLQRSFTFQGGDGQARMQQIMTTLRRCPPRELAGDKITSIHDYAQSGPLPPTDLVALVFDGARVLVRPSGTEPKLKLYVEASEQPGGEFVAAGGRVEAHCRRLAEAAPSALGLASA